MKANLDVIKDVLAPLWWPPPQVLESPAPSQRPPEGNTIIELSIYEYMNDLHCKMKQVKFRLVLFTALRHDWGCKKKKFNCIKIFFFFFFYKFNSKQEQLWLCSLCTQALHGRNRAPEHPVVVREGKNCPKKYF